MPRQRQRQHQHQACPHAYLIARVAVCQHCRRVVALPETSDSGAREVPVAMAARLTPREAEVVHLMAQGASERDIAAALSISRHTVHDHKRHMYVKLGARSMLDLALMYYGLRAVSPPTGTGNANADAPGEGAAITDIRDQRPISRDPLWMSGQRRAHKL